MSDMSDPKTSRPSPADSDAALRAKLPTQVKEQPDPFLQMSTGRVGAGGITLAACIVVLVLGVVLYGLNGRGTEQSAGTAPASAPAAAGTSGAPTTPAPSESRNGPHSG
jgi:hypothetical protein